MKEETKKEIIKNMKIFWKGFKFFCVKMYNYSFLSILLFFIIDNKNLFTCFIGIIYLIGFIYKDSKFK